eukprot:gnl/MRDRNA2_/MRDRNA2_30848_c0_seq1.p1 gnl/MRDRNA2_/MRDRNA2_30848_c0~~gnl/MRDRNA2_/MRDRNA2_30848_c0_seq1.p1  ORF type:complete len:182 (+),score=29.52 gnl/MRDRNA2_/MRDRNA2_30848_c0_seq1:81-626(+)
MEVATEVVSTSAPHCALTEVVSTSVWSEAQPQLNELQRQRVWLLMGGKLPLEAVAITDSDRPADAVNLLEAGLRDTPCSPTNGNAWSERELLKANQQRLVMPYPQRLWFHAPERPFQHKHSTPSLHHMVGQDALKSDPCTFAAKSLLNRLETVSASQKMQLRTLSAERKQVETRGHAIGLW